MSRLEFIKELAGLLDDLPREEKIEILKYYNGYFDDAGEENEAAVIAELGSPAKVAAEVKAGMQEDLDREEYSAGDQNEAESREERQEESQAGETTEKQPEREETKGPFGENGGSQAAYQYEQAHNRTSDQNSYSYDPQGQPRHKSTNGWKIIAIIAILMVTFPIWGGLLGGLLGLAGGIIGIAVAIVVGLFGALIGLVGTAVSCVVGGITALAVAPISGMLSLAVGIFLLGLMLLVGLLIGLIFGKLFPWIVSSIGKLVRWCGKSIGGILDGVTGRR